MNLDFSLDHNAWTNTEVITFQSVRKGGTPDLQNVPVAKRRALRLGERAASGGVYASGDRVWLIPAVMLAKAPKPADVIQPLVPLQDGTGDTWTVLEAEKNKAGATYRLTCRNLILAHDLRDQINVETPANLGDQDPTGAKAPKAWATKYSAIPARVQPEGAATKDERGIRGFATRFNCWVDRELTVTNEDRVLFGAQYYEIRGYQQSERIDELPMLELELVP